MRNLKGWRLERGWTQAELANKLSVHRVTVARYEAGHHIDPSVKTKLEELGFDDPSRPALLDGPMVARFFERYFADKVGRPGLQQNISNWKRGHRARLRTAVDWIFLLDVERADTDAERAALGQPGTLAMFAFLEYLDDHELYQA